MVPFRYALDGTVIEVLEPFDRLREPTKPISPEITVLTGITDAMVSGKSIDPSEVTAFAAPASVIIAHNAAFDRRFLERYSSVFSTKPWACSMSEIEWAAEGFEGTKLSYLAMAMGFFYERHRAANDCLAAIEILARELPRTQAPALAKLLERARLPTWRIWAENSPFEFKDILKARGYRWNGEENGKPRSWYVDVEDAEKEAEISYLAREIYRYEVDIRTVRVTAYDRFSSRV
ncbi:3'-5' exonuclease [[Pseudomonas] carboxydohydrogena]|uniref:3'-5' exonuclease n=1 Tax=Afipia carboxydohydrogena TaxID=290 RepID=A0ABY8BR45_AFICR|nr:3'-5' exonuclease [[Pseudomonas] carboxydohydrogena]WEF52031.1 3'-5' exonuclease [[Pseudomonas] carboxydohydrogena]